jgi:6,7-dimethyl-8-ribityllumazine synthase
MNQISATASNSANSAAANLKLTSAAQTMRVALITASWHRDIVDKARDAILAEFERCRLFSDAVDEFVVPGAFEIPLHAQRLAQTGRYDAIIACGLVVNGGIYRHDFVASTVINALMRVQLDTGVPVLSAVLTPRDFHEHDEHRSFFSEHFVKKGVEVASACLKAVASLRRIGPPVSHSTIRVEL